MKWKILSVAGVAVLAVTGVLLWLTEDRIGSARQREADLSLRASVQAVSQGLQTELGDLRELFNRENNEVLGSWRLLRPVSAILTFRRSGAELSDIRWLHSDQGPQRNITDETATKILKTRLPSKLDEGQVASLWIKGVNEASTQLVLVSRKGERWTSLWTQPGWMQSLVDLHKSGAGELMIADRQGRILAHSESEYAGSDVPGGTVTKWVLESGQANGVNFVEWPEDTQQIAAYERVPDSDWLVIHSSSKDRMGVSGWSELLMFGGAAALGVLLLAGVILARIISQLDTSAVAVVAPVSPRPVMAVTPKTDFMAAQQTAQTKNDRLANSSRIAAVVGSELSPSLAAILGYAQTILSTKPEASIAAAAESVLRESRRAREVVDKLLAFSGEAPVAKSPGRLNAVLTKVLKEFDSRFTMKQIKVVKTLPSTAEFPMSAPALEKAIRHLLENAIDATDRMATKELHIVLSETPEAVSLKIRDTGEGIAPENLARVTDPFFTTRGTGQAMGLGLSAALGVFKDHGAEMKIESEQGKGTTVSVEFQRPQKKVQIAGAQVALKVEEKVEIPVEIPKPVTASEPSSDGMRVLTPPSSPADVDIEGLLKAAEEAALEPVHEPQSAPPDAEQSGTGKGELELPAGFEFGESKPASQAAAPAKAPADEDRTMMVDSTDMPFIEEPKRTSVDAPKFAAPRRENKLDQVKVEIRRPGAGNNG